MEILVLFAVLVVVAVAAPRYGVDSREPGDWSRRTIPARDLAALLPGPQRPRA
jgi:hypothetical protein